MNEKDEDDDEEEKFMDRNFEQGSSLSVSK